MKYPKLVPPRLCNTEVRVIFTGDLNISGAADIIGEYVGKCNFLQKTKQVMTADKRIISLEAVALFDGDIEPNISNLKGKLSKKEIIAIDCEDGEHLEAETGEVLTFDDFVPESYNIFRTVKERNPDGTVNYTRVELI